MSRAILLVGCGKMGRALLDGWLDQGQAPASVAIVEPEAAARAAPAARGIASYADFSELPEAIRPEVVVLAIKPQAMATVLPPYRRLAGPGTVFLSIAAGTSIGFLSRTLGPQAAVVRAMPNTPAAIRQGITAVIAGRGTSDGQRAACEALLRAVGDVVWLADEGLMDAVTAVSGSGPAYVFLLIECLARAGIESGLPPALAEQLARATVSGSGALARQSSEAASTLRENVTSPGGTTAAALGVLMAPDGLQALLSRAVAAAARRSRELGAP
ncbi:MAG: pyrroline-5-carboxylate reductase [Alphaproteobacteria bacterium]